MGIYDDIYTEADALARESRPDLFAQPVEELKGGITGALGLVGENIPHILKQTLSPLAKAYQGGDPADVINPDSLVNRFIDWTDNSSKPDYTGYDENDTFIKIAKGAVDSGGSSLGYMPASLAGGQAGGTAGATAGMAIGGPPGAAIGGITGAVLGSAATSAPAMYRSSKYDFINGLGQELKAQGYTDEQVKSLLSSQDIQDLSHKHGLAEAGFEQADNPMEQALLGNKFAKNVIPKLGPKWLQAPLLFAAETGVNVASETATSVVQNPILDKARQVLGLPSAPKAGEGAGDKPLWDQTTQALSDVGWSTVGTSLVGAGAYGGANLVRNQLAKPAPEADPVQEETTPPPSLGKMGEQLAAQAAGMEMPKPTTEIIPAQPQAQAIPGAALPGGELTGPMPPAMPEPGVAGDSAALMAALQDERALQFGRQNMQPEGYAGAFAPPRDEIAADPFLASQGTQVAQPGYDPMAAENDAWMNETVPWVPTVADHQAAEDFYREQLARQVMQPEPEVQMPAPAPEMPQATQPTFDREMEQMLNGPIPQPATRASLPVRPVKAEGQIPGDGMLGGIQDQATVAPLPVRPDAGYSQEEVDARWQQRQEQAAKDGADRERQTFLKAVMAKPLGEIRAMATHLGVAAGKGTNKAQLAEALWTAKQAPVQQAPVQQAPVQQAPVQQAPVQQAPAAPTSLPTTSVKAQGKVSGLGMLGGLQDRATVLPGVAPTSDVAPQIQAPAKVENVQQTAAPKSYLEAVSEGITGTDKEGQRVRVEGVDAETGKKGVAKMTASDAMDVAATNIEDLRRLLDCL